MTFVAGGALKPIGGHILSHSSATRMFLRKGMFTRSMEKQDKANMLCFRRRSRGRARS